MNIQKELQNRIGELIGKDYFKLEFGQRIKKPYNMFQNGSGYVCGVDRSDVYVRYGIPSVEEDTAVFSTWEIKPEEIIGQEPSLNDVLMAIQNTIFQTGTMMLGNNLMFITTCGVTIEIDLSKSLFNQSEETLQAIYNLLK